MRSLVLTLCVLLFAAPAAAQARQSVPLPALGSDPATDRQVITILQQQLLTLGYPTAVTGHIGRDTREAITAFAIERGVSLDGPDTDRIVAIDTAYEALRAVPIGPIAPPTIVAPPPVEPRPVTHHTLPIVLGIGAVVLTGVGFAGVAMRESTIARYNTNCRGIGDPNPGAGCGQMANVDSANGATALAVAGLATGGLVAIVAAVLFARPTRSRVVAWRCGGGPGDVGISCGGAL